jgi:hypothetical protein
MDQLQGQMTLMEMRKKMIDPPPEPPPEPEPPIIVDPYPLIVTVMRQLCMRG